MLTLTTAYSFQDLEDLDVIMFRLRSLKATLQLYLSDQLMYRKRQLLNLHAAAE